MKSSTNRRTERQRSAYLAWKKGRLVITSSLDNGLEYRSPHASGEAGQTDPIAAPQGRNCPRWLGESGFRKRVRSPKRRRACLNLRRGSKFGLEVSRQADG
jgi:hypothetical protein